MCGAVAGCCAATFREHYNPFVPYLKLIGGFFSAILTILWIIHIILYMLFTPFVSTFLNKFLIFFDSAWRRGPQGVPAAAPLPTSPLCPTAGHSLTVGAICVCVWCRFLPTVRNPVGRCRVGSHSGLCGCRPAPIGSPAVRALLCFVPERAAQVGIFGLYLLMCAAKGNFKFGARFLLISVRAGGLGAPG